MRTITPRLLGESADPSEARPPAVSGAEAVGAVLMLITDGVSEPQAPPGAPPLFARIELALQAVPAGSILLQLRNKEVGGRELLTLAQRLRALTARTGALLFVNDRLDVALAAGADGVHVPQSGLPVTAARRAIDQVRPGLRISAATHSISEARMAAHGGADLVTFGPIWPTPSKPQGVVLPPGQSPVVPQGIEALQAVVRAVPVPVFALGGVHDPERAAACAQAGARIACLSAGLGSADPAAVVRALVAALRPATTRR